MAKAYTCAGSGFGFGANTFHSYWAIDFSNHCPVLPNPILAGSHSTHATGQTMFLANFFSYSNPTQKPRSAAVVINGVAYPLSFSSINSYNYAGAQGTFMKSLRRSTGCRSYYFKFVDGAGKTWLYPEKGKFYTYGEGPCSKDYSLI